MTATLLALALWLGAGAGPAAAARSFDLVTPGASKPLRDALAAASLLREANKDKTSDSQDLIAAAQADYGRLLGVLYAEGHYSGVIHILIDGQEASDIAPLDVPAQIRSVRITVDPGPPFHFAAARMKPYARGTVLPPAYADGALARSSAIADAAQAGVEGWRQRGHAKARIGREDIVADHRAETITSWLHLDPGPRVRFGTLTIAGAQRMRPERIRAIAGFPEGQVFDPDKLDRVATRLRKTGVFQSVSLTEAERLGPGDTLDVALTLVEEKKRRFGIGAEVGTSDGLTLSGYWLHRNLLGGAERLRIDALVSGIAGRSGGPDYSLGARLDRPATFTPDTTAYIEAGLARESATDYTSDSLTMGLGLSHEVSRSLTVSAGFSLLASRVRYPGRDRDYRLAALPLGAVWDRRDKPQDAHKGHFLSAEIKPFVGFGGTGSGARIAGDARIYWSPGDRVTLAGRAQIGSILGSSLLATPPDYLFFSGGAGTVRGQPYQSLGVQVLRGGLPLKIGGLSFAGFSGEIRARVTDSIGVVGFYDAGYVSPFEFGTGGGTWQSGAGIGLRYDTGFGPIRLDIAAPVSGPTGKGVQVYVGIGQAF